MKNSYIKQHTLPDGIQRDLRIVTAILLKYGVQRIVLYGSLARGDYHANSDIDICVFGLADKYYFRALAECLMQSETSVSIIDFNSVHGKLRENILVEGNTIYEA